MKKTLLTLTLVSLTTLLCAQISTTEKQALLDFYNATHGDQWLTSWDLEKPVEAWQGITIEDNKVTGISLLFNNLKGTLPTSLTNLEHLKVLELSFNKISGSIPKELGQLNRLEVLALNANKLTGSLPSELGTIETLKQLHVSSNKLSGMVPTTFEQLNNLEVFNVFDNEFTGALPKGLASIQSLREFIVAENNFTNPQDFSYFLLTNSGVLDLHQETTLTPAAKSVIAIETSDDEN